MTVINTILGLGAPVFMPVLFLIIGLIFGLGFGKAFKAGMLVGVGFVGVSLVISFLLDSLSGATRLMVDRMGLNLTVLDVGWGTASTIGWGSPLVPVVVVTFLALNILLLVIGVTKTIDIDIFNYWIFLLVGAVAYSASGSFWVGVGAAVVAFVVALMAGDLIAPFVQKQYNLKGVSFPHFTCLNFVPFGIAVNWLIEHTPGLRKIDFNPESISERFGVLGEPLVIGLVLGIAMGFGAGYGPDKAVILGVNVAAAMYILPKMIGILIEGLTTVRDGAEIRLKRWFPNREFYFGMDTALLIGEPSVLATGVLLIPIALLLAFILPGNKVLPFVDLPSLMFLMALVTPFCKRNMFRMLITGTLALVVIMYVGSDIAPWFTGAAGTSGISLPKGATEITNLVGGATTPLGWIIIRLAHLF
ncbi:PTS galactitol transporter subunit IIC [Acidipropionibacterium jensenii]|uniref:PTS galactitol transporter subunit IIC n=1 Tax=Acidipropionibacterium jensenii TaxID=1749 RepID=UPI00214C2B0E|nr:PTS transporter subunit IIC [Acidipropionibacterium jensenii]